MHFPIIKIEPIDLAREDWDIGLGYEDATLNEHTDYYGELYSPEDRKAVIESKWFKELFAGIATIDTEKETITFLDRGTIEKTLQDYYLEAAKSLYYEAQKERVSGYSFRSAGERFRDFYPLFVEGYGMTSLQFVENAPYRTGQTVQIGNIFDAHF